MKNKLISVQTILQFIFLVVAFVLVAALSTGFEFVWDEIFTWAFLTLCAVRLAFTLITYNIVFGIDNKSRRRVADSSYVKTMQAFKRRIDIIYKDSRVEELVVAVKEENKERKANAENKAIRKVTSRLSWDDIKAIIESKEDINDLLQKYGISEKAKRKLLNAIQKILDGKIKCEVLEVDDILIDNDEARDGELSMKFNAKAYILKQNLVKALLFLASTVIMTAISFTGGMANFWVELAKNATLLMSGAVSAILFSYNYIKRRTAVFEQKNRFLQRRMGIETA